MPDLSQHTLKDFAIAPSYLPQKDALLSLIAGFDYDGTEIYRARNVLKVFDSPRDSHHKLVIKSFASPNLVQKISYTFFRTTKCRRSFENAATLSSLGIENPTAVDYVEYYRWGFFDKGFYTCEFIPDTLQIRDLMQTDSPDADLLQALAQYILNLHNQGVEHLDLSAGNIIYHQDTASIYHFYLVDLNRIIFHPKPLTTEQRVHNLRKLIMEHDHGYLATCYAGLYSADPQESLAMATQIRQESKDFYLKRMKIKSIKRTYRKYGLFSAEMREVRRFYALRRLRIHKQGELSPPSPDEKALYHKRIAAEDSGFLYTRFYR
ncbi:lipopolysaccharide kinase InaA family protein [Porphyromonas pogonae]|uniref:lipopolysaccharide kinase InaA family protein n=1 Tax=Porphyromonas pogonae TaxID=867595 RepID=UPI002E771B63|nr:lipopolysaccharide kinase InaA family protein [Porphyromonas pogonae]